MNTTPRLSARTIDGPMSDRLIPVEEITETIDLPWSTSYDVGVGNYVERRVATRGAHVYELVERETVDTADGGTSEGATYRYIGERASERGDLIPATMTPVTEPGPNATVFTVSIPVERSDHTPMSDERLAELVERNDTIGLDTQEVRDLLAEIGRLRGVAGAERQERWDDAQAEHDCYADDGPKCPPRCPFDP